jgi:ubiquinone biosynthesis protein
LQDAAEGAGEIGRFLGQVPSLLSRAGTLIDQFDEITRNGLVLSPETVDAIGKAESRRNGWIATALWTIAALLAAIAWMLV